MLPLAVGASMLPAGASPFSALGGGMDAMGGGSTPQITASSASADTRINFSTGNMSSGTNFLNPLMLAIIGGVAILGVILTKTL